ncbi:hypothetical protein ES703_43954 [subsurface metagenome]
MFHGLFDDPSQACKDETHRNESDDPRQYPFFVLQVYLIFSPPPFYNNHIILNEEFSLR